MFSEYKLSFHFPDVQLPQSLPDHYLTRCTSIQILEKKSRNRSSQIELQQNSVNLIHTGQDRCGIIEYSGLSDGTQDLTGNYLTLLLYLGSTTNQRRIPFRYLLNLLVQGSSESSSVVCGVFIDEEDDGEDKESEDTTTVDIHTLSEAFLNISLRSVRFTEEAFFW